MKKKGFTLIELLAVIVILAMLSIITMSVISKLVSSAKLKAFKTKIYALESAAETYFEEEILDGDESVFKKGIDGTNSLTIHLNNKAEVKKLDIQGKTFNKGFVTITDEGKVSITAIEDNLCGQKLHSSSVINMLDIKEDFTCYLLDSANDNIDVGTQDVLTAIQNLTNDVSELKKENDGLRSSNDNLKKAIQNLSNNVVGSETALNKIYPVGSIYVSTTLKNKEEVKEALGGEWEVYGDGRVLRGTTGTSGETGGSSTVSLTAANLPEHNHSYTPSGSVSSTFKGTEVTSGSTGSGYSIGLTYATRTSGIQSANHTHSGTSESAGNHSHSVKTDAGNTLAAVASSDNFTSGSSSWAFKDVLDGVNATGSSGKFKASNAGAHTHKITIGANSVNHTHNYNDYYANSISGVQAHTHNVTAKGSVSSTFTGTKSNTESTGSNTPFSVLDPYITVYMYKRVK